MTIRQHVINYYKDGHLQAKFCQVCGGEGDMLFVDCPGPKEKDGKQPDFFDSKLDNDKEQS